MYWTSVQVSIVIVVISDCTSSQTSVFEPLDVSELLSSRLSEVFIWAAALAFSIFSSNSIYKCGQFITIVGFRSRGPAVACASSDSAWCAVWNDDVLIPQIIQSGLSNNGIHYVYWLVQHCEDGTLAIGGRYDILQDDLVLWLYLRLVFRLEGQWAKLNSCKSLVVAELQNTNPATLVSWRKVAWYGRILLTCLSVSCEPNLIAILYLEVVQYLPSCLKLQ